MQKKINTSIESLCFQCPKEFAIYLNYCRNLKFEQKPDYDTLKKVFSDLFKKSNYTYDYIFDWKQIAEQKKKEKQLQQQIMSQEQQLNSQINYQTVENQQIQPISYQQ
eukprot:TRINITY_DN2714_c1_g1_i1.p3 TRINITY_DN2714_c1_g1~~TRINITY_DN2714_c1_g1_i1.p3  ORF type:complete len:108 (-),score=8.05 TRINITY_DN2714_c1_g1_i1:146-469(-)